GLERALHGTRVDRVELHAAEPAAQLPRIVLTPGGEGQVRGARVLSREAPLGLAVAGEIQVDAQAGLPIISGRPERRERLALSITAPARTRCPGLTHTSPTAARVPPLLRASLTAASTRVAACAVPATSVSGRIASS